MAPRRPFVVDPVLTAITVGYRNPQSFRIADQVMPRSQVSAEKFKWTEYPIGESFNIPDARVGRKGRVQQLEFGGTERTAEVDDFGLDSPIPNSDIDAAAAAREQGRSIHDPEGHAAMMLTDTIANIREVRVANMVHAPASYDVNRRKTLAGNSQFSDYANSDPIAAIKQGFQKTLIFPPNTMVMGRDVWSAISSHPKIVNAVKGNVSNAGIISREQFVELFSGEGLTQLLVGDAWYNTARPGQAPALGRAWGKHISMLHLNPMASAEAGDLTWGMTAEYGGRISGRIEDPDIGLQGGYRIRVGERVKELVIAKDLGYFIQNAVA